MIYATRVISFIGLVALAASAPLDQCGWGWSPGPLFIYPTACSQVCIESVLHIQWDLSIPGPPEHLTPDIPSALYLIQDAQLYANINPIASGFQLLGGLANFSVPYNITPGKYQLALFGDATMSLSHLFDFVFCEKDTP
ncbi:hypothetical protein EV363DRAFT_1472938 [Boletus edulis]|nr:hypothetical protein EV363DRAFT_1472938 [Boletus edulis]